MNSTSALDPPVNEEPSSAEHGPEHPAVSGAPDAAGAAGAGERSLSKDELFHLLQNSRRRAVVRYLRGREGPVPMRDVAEQVAAWEHDTTVSGLSSDERQRVYVALYQSHLDALADAGVIEYDKPRGVIEPRPLLDRVAAYIDRPAPTGGVGDPGSSGSGSGSGEGERADGETDVAERTPARDPRASGSDREVERDAPADDRRDRVDTWGRRYLGVSVVGTALLIGTVLDITVLGALSGIAVSFLLLAAFSALTVAKLRLDGHGRDRTGDET
jgi:hypothetical protein